MPVYEVLLFSCRYLSRSFQLYLINLLSCELVQQVFGKTVSQSQFRLLFRLSLPINLSAFTFHVIFEDCRRLEPILSLILFEKLLYLNLRICSKKV